MRARAKRIVRCLLAGAVVLWIPSGASACLLGEPIAQETGDAMSREELARLGGLFEVEIISLDDRDAKLRVGRVFRGPLQSGTILRGRFGYNSCGTVDLSVGLRGFVSTSHEPDAEHWVRDFMRPELVESFRRIGALPAA